MFANISRCPGYLSSEGRCRIHFRRGRWDGRAVLTRLLIKNFKSWRQAELKLAPLTALFGASSSGKSSLIQFLLMLKQTKDSADRALALDFGNSETLVDLGSFREAVHAHDEDKDIYWELDWEAAEELRIGDPSYKRTNVLFRGTRIGVSSSVRLRQRIASSDFLDYDFSGSHFRLERGDDNKAGFQLQASGPSEFRFIRNLGRAWDLPGPTRSYAFPDQARTYFQNAQFLSEFKSAYVRQMDAIVHLGPLRDYPRRQYIWSGSSPTDVGRRGEHTIDAILSATARGETRNLRYKYKHKPFQEIIAWWLAEMGLINEFRIGDLAPGSGI